MHKAVSDSGYDNNHSRLRCAFILESCRPRSGTLCVMLLVGGERSSYRVADAVGADDRRRAPAEGDRDAAGAGAGTRRTPGEVHRRLGHRR